MASNQPGPETLSYEVAGTSDVPQYGEITGVQIGGRWETLPVPTAADNSTLHLLTEDSSTLRLARNEAGHTTLHIAATRTVGMMSGILADYNPPEAVVLLNDKTENEGWTSLHISTIKNNEKVVRYILDTISDKEQKKQFINEVDREGWTSLRWGAALDNVDAVEATFSRMSVTHQEETMIGDWTLLHATATRNAVTTMEYLMGRWDSDTQWKILKCPTSDGKTALHIAVAEGNAKAAIMLLDIAGGKRQSLLLQPDKDGNVARDYTSNSEKQKHFREYLEIATVFDDPVLHRTTERDDRSQASWILDHCVGSKFDTINITNCDGLTVLQKACKENSVEIIKMIWECIGHDDFFRSMILHSTGGETGTHIAAINSNSSALHTVLKVLKPDSRKLLLKTENSSGENALHVAKKLKHQSIINIIEYHSSILSDLMEHFINFEHSLFTISRSWSAEEKKIKYERIEKRQISDKGFVRNVNYDASTCIAKGDIEYAQELVEKAIEVDGDNIHTWCNKGVLSLKLDPPHREEAEEAAFRMVELMSELTGVPRLRAKIDYAYWLAEACRSESAYESSFQIFADVQRELERYQKSECKLSEYCSYRYVKVLVRHVRSDYKSGKPPSWTRNLLDRVVNQLIVLSMSTSNEYLGDMWLWLVEVQCTRVPQGQVETALNRFTKSTRIEAVDPLACLNKVRELSEKLSNDHKIKARIARNLLDYAYRCADIQDREYFFKNAQELSEQWMADNYWTHLSATTSAQALFNLWAMEFYKANRELVLRKYKQIYPKRAATSILVWRFLTTTFCSQEATNSECTYEYLEPAERHFHSTVQRADGWVNNGVKLAVIKSLLGDDKAEVEDAFNKAIEHSDAGFRRAIAHENYGIYYLEYGWLELANVQFQLAIVETEGTSYTCSVAIGGLRIINQQNSRTGVRRRYQY